MASAAYNKMFGHNGDKIGQMKPNSLVGAPSTTGSPSLNRYAAAASSSSADRPSSGLSGVEMNKVRPLGTNNQAQAPVQVNEDVMSLKPQGIQVRPSEDIMSLKPRGYQIQPGQVDGIYNKRDAADLKRADEMGFRWNVPRSHAYIPEHKQKLTRMSPQEVQALGSKNRAVPKAKAKAKSKAKAPVTQFTTNYAGKKGVLLAGKSGEETDKQIAAFNALHSNDAVVARNKLNTSNKAGSSNSDAYINSLTPEQMISTQGGKYALTDNLTAKQWDNIPAQSRDAVNAGLAQNNIDKFAAQQAAKEASIQAQVQKINKQNQLNQALSAPHLSDVKAWNNTYNQSGS